VSRREGAAPGTHFQQVPEKRKLATLFIHLTFLAEIPYIQAQE
jgi:hypothetical protein